MTTFWGVKETITATSTIQINMIDWMTKNNRYARAARSLSNDDVKFSEMRFCRQRAPTRLNLSLTAFV